MGIGKRTGILALILALAVTGCGTTGTQSSSSRGEGGNATAESPVRNDTLRIPLDNTYGRYWVVDVEGNTVEDSRDFIVLQDVITGKPQCQYLHRVEATGKTDQYGNPETRTMESLYDMEGNLLQDWAEVSYMPGTGNSIIRQDAQNFMMERVDLPEDYQSALWDFTTGESVVPDAGSCAKVGEDKLLVSDYRGKLMGVLNSDGSVYSGFPATADYFYAYPVGEWITADTVDYQKFYGDPDFDWDSVQEEQVLLNAELERKLSRPSLLPLQFEGMEDAFQCIQDSVTTVINSEGETLYQTPPGFNLSYFDGEVAIIQEQLDDAQGFRWVYKLVLADGTPLSEGFRELMVDASLDGATVGKVDRFVGVKENKAELLNRGGKVLASAEIPGVTSIVWGGEGRYVFTVEADGPDKEPMTDIPYAMGASGLLDENLAIILPATKYSYIYQVSYWDGEALRQLDCYQGSVQTASSNQMLTDLLDRDGNVVVSNISAIYDVREDRMAVVKGFSMGLMDFRGNWIVKRSIFNEYTED